MSMLRLPNELILELGSQLERERDINALARANRRLFGCLNQLLYSRNIHQFNSSALVWAAAGNNEQTLNRALGFGAQAIGEALTVAASEGHENVIATLLSAYTADDDLAGHGQRAIFLAISMGYASIAQLLVLSGKIQVDSKNSEGMTPLSCAASIGHGSIVKLLIDTGGCVDVNSKDHNGRTPLSHAAEAGQDSAIQLLLDTGKVDVNARDERGWTPLSYAVSVGADSVVELLLSTGKLDIESRDSYGRTPISQAKSRGYMSIMRLLLDSLEAGTMQS